MLMNGVSSNYWGLSRKDASVWEQSWEQIENKLRENHMKNCETTSIQMTKGKDGLNR